MAGGALIGATSRGLSTQTSRWFNRLVPIDTTLKRATPLIGPNSTALLSEPNPPEAKEMIEKREAWRSGRIVGRTGARLRFPTVMAATVTAFTAVGGSAWAVAANSIGSQEQKRNAVGAPT